MQRLQCKSAKCVAMMWLVVCIVCVLAGSCYGRPEPPVSGGGGYNYSPPSSSYGAPATRYGPPQASPVIHKHVYVHVPPPEPEYVAQKKPIVLPPPQKHYKIVFIKAPSAPAPQAPVIPALPVNEEKTLVYVLVKRPDEQPDVVVPTAAPTQPSKPEVYFIRYKTQKQDGYPESVSPVPSAAYGAPPSSQYGVPN